MIGGGVGEICFCWLPGSRAAWVGGHARGWGFTRGALLTFSGSSGGRGAVKLSFSGLSESEHPGSPIVVNHYLVASLFKFYSVY